MICDCRTDKQLEQEAVEFLSRKRVDGIINMPVDTEGGHLKDFQKTGKPIVLIDRKIQGVVCDSVLVDKCKTGRCGDQNSFMKKDTGISGSLEVQRRFHIPGAFEGVLQDYGGAEPSDKRMMDRSWRLYHPGRR